MNDRKEIVNAISIDVEDYFHVSAFASAIDRADWHKQESRVTRNTEMLLDMFDDAETKCTFFVLGCVAEQYPHIVRTITDRGHEVASHGYSHRLIYEQTPEEFRNETLRSKQLLEDLAGQSVKGYRAASYSITDRSLWALEILADAGFEYDSSIFPVRHDRYGIPDAPTLPHRITLDSGRQLVEFPMTTVGLPGYRLPIAGGGYFRIFPYFVTKWAYRYLNNVKKAPVVFYLHPWEIDPSQPRIEASRLSKFRHYRNLEKTEARLKDLLKSFHFTTIASVLADQHLADHAIPSGQALSAS